MLSFINSWAESIWLMLIDSAFLFIIGLLLAGLLRLVMNEKNIARHISEPGIKGVFKAALIGIPLPLCSCSVLPVARQLKEGGASKSSVMSFLIATPESGVDSIMLTYTLTDPILTVTRPVVAFLTAFTAGFSETFFNKKTMLPTVQKSGCDNNCACASTAQTEVNGSIFSKIYSGIKYAFSVMLDDLAPYLFFGFVLAGFIGAVLGTNLVALPEVLRTGWLGYLGAVIIGLPLYVCATSSTPLAAVLLGSGFSPGAVLVFLMVGPATNIASLVVLKKILGVAATFRYLAAIVIVSVICGIAVDEVYDIFNATAGYQTVAAESGPGILSIISAVVLSLFIVYYSVKRFLKKLS